MKKIFTFVFLLVAIVSFGGNIHQTHAATLTPQETASLQASLDVLKAKLQALQTQVATQTTGSVVVSPISTQLPALQAAAPSPEEAKMLNGVLSSLTTVLTSLKVKLSENPNFATQNASATLLTLRGIGKTLAAINTMAGNQSLEAAGDVAIARSNSVPSLAIPVHAPESVTQVISALPSPAQTSPVKQNLMTAQISSHWSFTKVTWSYIGIGLFALVALALWFRRSDNGEDEIESSRRTPQLAPVTASTKTAPLVTSPLTNAVFPAFQIKKEAQNWETSPRKQQRKSA